MVRYLPDDCRMILGHLSDAVLASWSMQASTHTTLAVLWEPVKGNRIRSALYERKNAILFHDRIGTLQGVHEVLRAVKYGMTPAVLGDMRPMQAQCELWRNGCEFRYE